MAQRDLAGVVESVEVVWQYTSSDGECWRNMDKFYNDLYESQYQRKSSLIIFDHQYANKTKNYNYVVDFDTMIQINETTGKQRGIRRTIVARLVNA